MWSHFQTCGMIREEEKLNDKIEKAGHNTKKTNKKNKILNFQGFRPYTDTGS